MKIRATFVSNSSSTSFCMISRVLKNQSEIIEQILKGNEIIVFVDGGDGSLLVTIKDLETFSYVKAFAEFNNEKLTYHLAYAKAFDGDVEIDFSSFPKDGKARLESTTIDQNTLDDKRELVEYLMNYDDNWEEIKIRAIQIAKTLVRKEKLEQIEKSED